MHLKTVPYALEKCCRLVSTEIANLKENPSRFIPSTFSGVRPFFTFNSFDIPDLIHHLTTVGAASVPLLNERWRSALQQEAEQYEFVPEVKVLGTGDRLVRTEYGAFDDFPVDSLYLRLMQDFQALMEQAIAELSVDPFYPALQFNSGVLQQYEPGQLGITPHRDSLKAVNLICLFNISGVARFYCYDDRNGTNAVELDTTPGYVIFLRAPGFLGSSERPFHAVADIRSRRYSFGLRQKLPPSSSQRS